MIQQRLGESFEEYEKRKRRVKLQSVGFESMLAHSGSGGGTSTPITITNTSGVIDGLNNTITENNDGIWNIHIESPTSVNLPAMTCIRTFEADKLFTFDYELAVSAGELYINHHNTADADGNNTNVNINTAYGVGTHNIKFTSNFRNNNTLGFYGNASAGFNTCDAVVTLTIREI